MLVRHGRNGPITRVEAPDGPPPVGTVIGDTGQYYYTVASVTWMWTSTFWRRRLETVVTLDEHDRADEYA